MDIVNAISTFLNATDKFFGWDYPGTEEWRAETTPDNIFEKMKELNSLPNVIKQSTSTNNKEWCLNSFEYAANNTPPERMVEMGHYMAYNEVFNNVASSYAHCNTSQLVSLMFDRCADQDTKKLLDVFEGTGLMGTLARAEGLGIRLYVNRVAASMDVENTIRLLKYTDSFQIAKHQNNAASIIIGEYPQFAPLLD